MPSLRNLGIIHFAFINNHFSLIILDPISVHSVSSVVNPTRANRPTFLVPLSVDFRAIPWPVSFRTHPARDFSLQTYHF
jgi:hypothetical protein